MYQNAKTFYMVKDLEKLNTPLKLEKNPKHYESYLHGLHPLHSWVVSVFNRGTAHLRCSLYE